MKQRQNLTAGVLALMLLAGCSGAGGGPVEILLPTPGLEWTATPTPTEIPLSPSPTPAVFPESAKTAASGAAETLECPALSWSTLDPEADGVVSGNPQTTPAKDTGGMGEFHLLSDPESAFSVEIGEETFQVQHDGVEIYSTDSSGERRTIHTISVTEPLIENFCAVRIENLEEPVIAVSDPAANGMSSIYFYRYHADSASWEVCPIIHIGELGNWQESRCHGFGRVIDGGYVELGSRAPVDLGGWVLIGYHVYYDAAQDAVITEQSYWAYRYPDWWDRIL